MNPRLALALLVAALLPLDAAASSDADEAARREQRHRDAAQAAGASLWDARGELSEGIETPRAKPAPPPKPETVQEPEPAPEVAEPKPARTDDEAIDRAQDEMAELAARRQRAARDLRRAAQGAVETQPPRPAAPEPVAQEGETLALATADALERARHERESLEQRIRRAREGTEQAAASTLNAARRERPEGPAPTEPSAPPVGEPARRRREQRPAMLARAQDELTEVKARIDRLSRDTQRVAARAEELARSQADALARRQAREEAAARSEAETGRIEDARRHDRLTRLVGREAESQARRRHRTVQDKAALAERFLDWAEEDAQQFEGRQARRERAAQRAEQRMEEYAKRELERTARDREDWAEERQRTFDHQLHIAEEMALATAEDAAQDVAEQRDAIVREVLDLAEEMEREAEKKEQENRR